MRLFAAKKSITKKAICLIMALALAFVCSFSVAISSLGQTITYDILPTRLGTSDTYYSFDAETKTLTISGTGDTPNFLNSPSSIPWYEWTSDTVENVVVEPGITKLGNYMFYQMAADNYSLPFGLTSIGRYCFSFNNRMTNIDIPYGVENIMLNAFASCYNLARISLPSTLKTIGSKAFYYCTALDNVVIPSSVTTIDTYAFNKCYALADLRFESPTQKTKIGNYAFQECSSLGTVTFPLNVTLGVRSFGYQNASTIYSDALMRVYKDSPAYSYAVGNGVAYELIDVIPIECGVENPNSYTADDLSVVYHYTFTPEGSGTYNFYSTGNCDLVGKLYHNGTLLAEHDDIAQDNRNFCISYALTANETYDLLVSTVKQEGDYSIYVFSDDITGVEVLNGSIAADISDSKVVDGARVFLFSNERFADFLFRFSFANGDEAIMPYNSFMLGYKLVSGDNQRTNPYTCGDNVAHILIKDLLAEYPLSVEHSYSETIIAPTVDDDGYSIFTCIICDDSYRANEVPTTSYIVSGSCVLAENPYGRHLENIPYSHAKIKIGRREYSVNADGSWQVRTFENCFAVFENDFGGNFTIRIDVENNGSYDYGYVALDGYDLNKDGYVNAKDYVIYRKQMYGELGENYWRYGVEYLISHRTF